MAILWLDDISADDLDRVGGKAASLGELVVNDLPVPPAFVVTADTYRSLLEETDIDEELEAVLDVDNEDADAVAEAAERARSLVRSAEIPAAVGEEIDAAYDAFDGAPPVAVRSSATAEDLPDASFAGQQETFLNVSREDVLDRVQACWASLFTERAIHYRQRQGYSHADVDIAVVVQRMVDAEKSGVCFSSHPSTGADQVVVEAAWGLGEAVVSGAVTPDNYVIDRDDGALAEVTVADKTIAFDRDDETGETVERTVSPERRAERVLGDEELDCLVAIAERVESHYARPQDIEWAIAGEDVYLLQSRPITTIDEAAPGPGAAAPPADDGNDSTANDAVAPTAADGDATISADGDGPPPAAADAATTGAGDAAAAETADGGMVSADEAESDDGFFVQGLGAAPGVATGRARIVRGLDQLDKVETGDIIVTEMTTPDMVTAMKQAAGLVTDEGGMTSHAAIVSRELGVPAVVGTTDATRAIDDGDPIRIDGETGIVTVADEDASVDGETGDVRPADPRGDRPASVDPKPMTATAVKVNLSIPDAAERAAATGADGVGLLRTEHMILSTDKTPARYVADHGSDAYTRLLVDDIRTVAEAFYPRPVRVRTLDAPTDEFRQLEGGEDEPHEHNPMSGYRGLRRSLDEEEIFRHELAAFRRLYEMGYDNVEVMFPVVNDAEDVLGAKRQLEAVGIDPDKRSWGVMVETPASALEIESICRTGVDFASFGTNDLTQHTLAVDRNNERVADRFDELHPAVLELISRVIDVCRDHDVATSICGQAGSRPEMVRHLVTEGVTSISANIDAVRDVQHRAMRVEQRCLLEAVRD